MFGFDAVADFTHHVETVLDLVRRGKLNISSHLIDLVLASRDHIRKLLEDPDPTYDKTDSELLITELQRLLPEVQDNKPDMPEIRRIVFQPPSDIMSRGMEPVFLLDELRDLGKCRITADSDAIPPLKDLNPEQCYLKWEIILESGHPDEVIRDIFTFIEEESRITITEVCRKDPAEHHGISGENRSALQQDTGIRENTCSIPDKDGRQQGKKFTGSGIRVAAEKLDTLVNLVGELVTVQSCLSGVAVITEEIESIKLLRDFSVMAKKKNKASAAASVKKAGLPEILSDPLESLIQLAEGLVMPLQRLKQLSTELRECALHMRMLPIGTIFGKYRRLVRDLACELGKEVDFVTEGGETELDKNVIEGLTDPLIHLIRNAADHGIQKPDIRKKQGKPPAGTIKLNAFHKSGTVVITLEDDGNGLDPEIIREKALQKGLIGDAENLSEDEICSLILTPGFSTAQQLSKVSGRGVGMDVVKREIEALNGSIGIENRKGEYLRVVMNLPLTLAMIEGLLVQAGNTRFVLPVSMVKECLDMKRIKKGHGRNVILQRGELIPCIRLREIFRIEEKPPENSPDSEHLVIIHVQNETMGIVVDYILKNIQVVMKSLDKNFRKTGGVAGAAVMGDGSVALVADIPGLIRYAVQEELIGKKRKTE